jgi:ABC-type transporter Mla MlaB component
MRQVVATELKRSPALLALDLTRVDGIDTEGIATLVSAATQAGESDISFCLVGAQAGPVRAAFRLAHRIIQQRNDSSVKGVNLAVGDVRGPPGASGAISD